MMICHPLTYSKFISLKSMVKYLLSGTGVCLVLVTDSLVEVFVYLYLVQYRKNDTIFFSVQKVLTGFETYKLVKIITVKMIYTVAILRMAIMTKSCLDESMNMNKHKRKQNVFKRLFYFTLIPIFLNFLFVGHEALSINFAVFGAQWDHTKNLIQPITTLVVFTLGSFIYIAGFISLFSDLRKAVTCRRTTAVSSEQ